MDVNGNRDADWFAAHFDALTEHIGSVIQGKREVVRLALVALFAEGHLLLEDVPGVGKTMLARAIAASVAARWRRIQFTPDLLPTDITGVSIYDPSTRQFPFRKGPVFANIVLADEINRASPKTQSALLEVMAERQVTMDGTTHEVDPPFLVIATQNPIERGGGTYPLPEAQLDRFLMRTSMGHPDVDTEIEILRDHGGTSEPVDAMTSLIDLATLASLTTAAQATHTSDQVLAYIAAVADGTRRHPDLLLGASPRASIGLLRAARVIAAADRREYVIPEDVKYLAKPVLAHRLLLRPEAEQPGHRSADVVDQVLATVPVPRPVG